LAAKTTPTLKPNTVKLLIHISYSYCIIPCSFSISLPRSPAGSYGHAAESSPMSTGMANCSMAMMGCSMPMMGMGCMPLFMGSAPMCSAQLCVPPMGMVSVATSLVFVVHLSRGDTHLSLISQLISLMTFVIHMSLHNYTPLRTKSVRLVSIVTLSI